MAQQIAQKAEPTKRAGTSANKKSKTQLKQNNSSTKPKPRKKSRRLKIPKPETLLALVRLYLVALDQAIIADNFRVLHAISGPNLTSKMSASQLAGAFRDLRSRRIDLAAVVITTPQITESPEMLPGNILNIVGHFPTRPERINFHMQFQPTNRQWRLRGMKVTTKRVKQADPKANVTAKKTKTSVPAKKKPAAGKKTKATKN
ncbi:MAG: hypothetical protein JXQ99_29085 [Hyphomicrobiaceae bacterium]